MAENLAQFGKMHKTTDSRSCMNPKQNKAKKYTPRYIIVKLIKPKDKGKILKAAREEQHLLLDKK